MEERLGGFTQVAQRLSQLLGKNVSRQQVYMWWKRRDRNGFPEAQFEKVPGVAKPRVMFDYEEVATWHEKYVPNKGGRKRKQEEEPYVPVARL